MNRLITVNDRIQTGYQYVLTEPEGENFAEDFHPELTPSELLSLGIFGGLYMTDCREEFPYDWYVHAKLSPGRRNPHLNYYKVNASLPLKVWQEKGWIYAEDPRGWFQWYCRYYRGRRIPGEDRRQIRRWKGMTRHIGAIRKNCIPWDDSCRPRQKQALLHWAYDARKL